MDPSFNQTTPEEMNAQRSMVLIPALVFVIVFMFIGLFGNGLVIYIYGWRLTNTSIHVLLLLLACFDMFCCVIGLPLQIVELRMSLIYPSSHLCKLSAFVTFYSCNASILTLLAICALRYHKVCRFSKRQMTVDQGRMLAVLISVVSLPLTIPAVMLYDVIEMPPARICLFRGSYDKLWIYIMTMFVYNLIILTAMFVLYGRIWVKVRKHDDQLRRKPSECSSISKRKPRTKNRTFVGITVLYSIGFLPCLLLGVLYPVYGHIILSNGLEALRNVLFRTWILNSTMNPVIYGFFGLSFRREAKKIFNRSVSRNESVTSETPE